MRHDFLKGGLLSSMLVFCAVVESQAYDITINVNGREYYSDANGFAHQKANAEPVQKKAPPKGVNKSFTANSRNKQYKELIVEASKKHSVDPGLIDAVIQTESAYNANAVSPAGAVGLMQLMPGTARQYGVYDRYDPVQNIDGGVRYLRHLLDKFDSNLTLTLAAYNAGENAVIRNSYAVPPYRETRNYVKQVLSLTGNKENAVVEPNRSVQRWPGVFISIVD